jgi:hypothetical protein
MLRLRGSSEAPILLPLLLLLIAAVGVDAFRVGFFADDFHFLDVARRLPLTESLAGQYGIWPWYRPLSRELFFELVAVSGAGSHTVAHGLALGLLFGCAALLVRVGTRLAGAPAAAVAVCLFVTYAFTKFLTAWASGFQDLMALFLTLLAIDARARGRDRVALASAALAAFAKETGFVAFPLLAVLDRLPGRDPPRRDGARWPRLVPLALVFAVAVAIHVAVRLTWRSADSAPRAEFGVGRLPAILGEVLGGFVVGRPTPGAASVVLAILAGGSAAWLIAALDRRGEARPAASPGANGFLALAAALGLAPFLLGHLLKLTLAHAYHAFPAIPWIALALGRMVTRLPAPVWRAALPALVAWNAWGSGFRPPDLQRAESWVFGGWNWREAVRLTAVSGRLTDDVRAGLARRPDRLVVLYEGMPQGCFFQTEDGPATREALGDSTVRAYWINEPGPDISAGRVMVLAFDIDRFHLERVEWPVGEAIRRALNAVVAGRGRAASAFVQVPASRDSARFDRDYLGAAAALVERGPAEFVAALAAMGLEDTLGENPARLAALLASVAPGAGQAFEVALRHPRSADSHLALADSLLARGLVPRAALEMRIALTLEPGRPLDRYRLAQLMAEMGGTVEAMAELRRITDDPAAGPIRAPARAALLQLESLGKRAE